MIARAVSRLPNNTRDARLALYDLAEIALTAKLLESSEISDEQMAAQRLALEWTIRKIECEARKEEQPEKLQEKQQRPFTSFYPSSGLCCRMPLATRAGKEGLPRASSSP